LFILSLYFCHLDFFAGKKQESESPPAQTAEPPAAAEPNDATESPDDRRDIGFCSIRTGRWHLF